MAKILVIDDDIMNLTMVGHILERRGYEVVMAQGGREGIHILEHDEVDLLLLDVEMENMSGMETFTRIRKNPKTSDIRTLCMMTSAYQGYTVEALRLGALGFIKKPILPEQLFEQVEKVLQKTRKDILLAVDDEPINLLMAKRIFGIRYQVETESNGEAALAAIPRVKPDLILLDLHMPQMSGLEVFDRLHKMDGYEDIPVIFLTADEEKETEVKIFKAGASDYIKKPVVAEVAIQRINRILEMKHLQDSLQDEVDRKTKALQISNKKVKNLSKQIMYALSGAIDAKDAYTNGHSGRVAEYARMIAVRMGYTGTDVDDVYAAGLLHDVGKIGISDAIINKPGRLTEEEYRIIKGHTSTGARILEQISELPLLSVGAHWHHERYDGSGYPDGLVGKNIPEIARIVCVADCYDAMTSKRSYRDILPQVQVRREIEMGMGSQFDPEIASIMLQMIDEDINYSMREK